MNDGKLSFYDYEKNFAGIMDRMSRKLLEKNICTVPGDRLKKNTRSRFGFIEIANGHAYSTGAKGFQISPLMQEKMVFAGQYDNYGRANKVIEVMLDREVSATQVHRVTQAYGKGFSLPEQAVRSLTPPVTGEVVYAQVDGGMILTREKENNWKEVKVGRVFKSKDSVDESANRICILQSQYVAHLGEKEPFCKTMDELLDDYGGSHLKERLVFISDGAVWIRNWSKDMFSKAVHVLDYYHATEHLYDFVKLQFKDDTQGKLWGKRQETLLLDSKVSLVITAINRLEPVNAEAKKGQQDLSDIIQPIWHAWITHVSKKIGAGIIGSGGIESTHRTLVQKRLKQFGQRWTRKVNKTYLI